MKSKVWGLFDATDACVAAFRSKTDATDALAKEIDGRTRIKGFHFLTATQLTQLHYGEAVAVESLFERKSNERKASLI